MNVSFSAFRITIHMDFRQVFGHEKVAVLQGGLPAWLQASYKTESGPAQPVQAKMFRASFNHNLVKTADQIFENIKSGEYQVVDARSAGRFSGAESEPRAGLKSGHIPMSKNIPYGVAFDGKSGRFVNDLLGLFEKEGVDVKGKPLVTTCGSGVTASALSLALYSHGINSSVYDGSFSEWGRGSYPVER